MIRRGWLIVWTGCLLALSLVAQTQRGVSVPPRAAATAGNGSYYALVIGINGCQHLPPLQTAVNDARAIDAILRQRYGFQTKVLLDAEATRANIINALYQYRAALAPNDNLLVYYAGHGASDSGEAYWLPVDVDPKSPANRISANDITAGIKAIPAEHVLIISDSCYSGAITMREVDMRVRPTAHDVYVQEMLSSKSRNLLSSGRDEPVSDSGSGGHSVFANAVLDGLAKMNEQSFTAANLYENFVRYRVIGGSKQVPEYKVIQDSGHQYGDFVFFARSGVVAGGSTGNVSPVPDRPGPSPKPPAGDTTNRATTTRLGPDGRSAQAAPVDPSGAVPLTGYRAVLMMVRDLPPAVTDALMTDIAKWQIIGEQSNWKLLDAALARGPGPGVRLNPQRSQFIFEWQKYIEDNPAFASSALLPVFLRQDADWSFLKKEKGWDEQYDAYVLVFLFARDKIQGRQADFAARELAAVVKRHLQMAAARAPAKLYFDVQLRTRYDFNSSAIRFQQKDTDQPADAVDLLQAMKDATFESPARPAQTTPTLPTAARSTANYWLSSLSDTALARPGLQLNGADPQEAWRKSVQGNTFNMRFPPLGGIALDRELKLTSVPLDAKRAEPLHQVLANLHARVYISADRVDLFAFLFNREPRQQALMFAHLQKVEILGPKNELIATIAAQSLPAAK